MRCAECQWKYPDSFMHPMFTNGGYTQPICGICALELVNKAHGHMLESFTGTMAEATRQSAIKWRKRHPQDAPVSH